MLFGAVAQFAVGDHRNHRLAPREGRKTAHDLGRTPPAEVDACVAVEHVAGDRQSPSRSCGGPSPTSSGKSSGSEARRSKTRKRFCGFSRKTTSSPRRKISTSSEAKRKSFGRRTAWLLPDLKTLAVGIASLRIYVT